MFHYPRHHRVLLISQVLILCAASASGQKNSNPPPKPPPPPAYTPPSRSSPPPAQPSYRPSSPPSSNNARPANHVPYTPPRSYRPRANPGTNPGASRGVPRPQRPSTTNAPRTYTPGASSSSGNGSRPTTSPGTTYTPHVYTPGSSSTTGVNQPASTSGTTTYTPHVYTPGATSSNSVGPKTEGGATTSTPGKSSGPLGSSFSANLASRAGPRTATERVYSVPGGSKLAISPSGVSTLPPASSQSVLHQVNSARSSLTGINKNPLPQGTVAVHSDGKLTVMASNGRRFDVRPNGTIASFNGLSKSASFRSDGRMSAVHSAGMNINVGPHGQRTVVSEQADHSRLVSVGRNSGYLERPVFHNGHSYVERTYVVEHRSVTMVYTNYRYHGLVMVHYLPRYYYAPEFYGWAYYPWSAPVVYAWGWGGAPWFAYYGGYFSPWNTYLGGANWLADYYIGQTLAAGYVSEAPSNDGQQQADAAYPNAQPTEDEAYAQTDTPITPEVKQAIADEVQRQLAYENAASTQPEQAASLSDLPQVMTPNHMFVVSESLNVVTSDGQSCGLAAGEVVRLVATPAEDSPTADLTVVSSRRLDCPAGVTVSLNIEDLEEMQNNFRAQLDSGLKTLHDRQGQGGLPGAPNSAIAPPPRPGEDVPEDNTHNVEALLSAQDKKATQVEFSMTQVAFAGGQ
jgi:hypothetical protein